MRVQIVHALPGRLRVAVPEIRKNQLLLNALTENLRQLPGVESVRGNVLTGRILIRYQTGVDPDFLLAEILKPARISPPEAVPADLDQVPDQKPPHIGDIPAPPKKYPTEEVCPRSLFRRGVSPFLIQKRCVPVPLDKQLLHVILGGSVLAGLAAKRVIAGPSALARSRGLFYLAAGTALVSGYPLLKSGLQNLSSRGRINYDLVLAAASIATVLLRESIPGLAVIWLANLTNLVQRLMVEISENVAREYVDQNGEKTPVPALYARGSKTGPLEEQALEYAEKTAPVSLALSTLGAVSSRDYDRGLAMLLAGSPSPAAICIPAAFSPAMAAAARNGILLRSRAALETLSSIDTIVFTSPDLFINGYLLNSVLPMTNYSEEEVLCIAAKVLNNRIIELPGQSIDPNILRGQTERLNDETLVIGTGEYLRQQKISTFHGRYKTKRLEHLRQLPVFVARNRKLVGLLGAKPMIPTDVYRAVNHLRAGGVHNLYLLRGENAEASSVVSGELGLQVLPTKAEQLRELDRAGKRFALAGTGLFDDYPGDTAAVHIALFENCCPVFLSQADVIISGGLQKLPRAFSISHRAGEKAKQNMALTRGLNALGLALGASGILRPVGSTIYNNLISIAVTINSLAILRDTRHMDNKNLEPQGFQSHSREEETAAAMEAGQNGPLLTPVHWAILDREDLLNVLNTISQYGLEPAEAALRLSYVGPNKLETAPSPGLLARICNQCKDFLVAVLIGSSLVCIILGEKGDALAIITIVGINALLGAVQEHKAEGALSSLREMTAPRARVIRGGKTFEISAAQLVPGDLVLMEQGDGVPADVRFIEAYALEVEESALTGESHPVKKYPAASAHCTNLLDCNNIGFMGTTVAVGKGTAVVVATGMNTEMGKIAQLLKDSDNQQTPLHEKMAAVGKTVLKTSLTLSGLMVVAGLLRGGTPVQMFLTGVSLAVAAIPEGLPAIITIALASGVKRMASSGALVKQLSAVETLGNTTVICTDKTGTLTHNRQVVKMVYTAGDHWWEFTGDSYDPAGGKVLPAHNGSPDETERDNLLFTLSAASLCSNAFLVHKQGHWSVQGDPTEGAILAAVGKAGLDLLALKEVYCRQAEIPFDSSLFKMTVVCRDRSGNRFVFVKGAPEVLVESCARIKWGSDERDMNLFDRRSVITANEKMADDAMRVLAVAYKKLPGEEHGTAEPGQESDITIIGDIPPEDVCPLTFLGLIGMYDPPRREVAPALEKCRRAGIRAVMITGDHKHTALAIGKKLSIADSIDQVLTGHEMEEMTDAELLHAINDKRIFARVLPQHKLRVVKAFQSRDETVAMIGDGVNDAPAVKAADVGVAMGISGTDVTRESAQLIITDDNFATVVIAAEQGRGIYRNIRNSIRYLLATNAGEVILMFSSVIAGKPMPLLPIQLLGLNLLGDGLPAVALGVEAFPPGLMDKPPVKRSQTFFDREYRNRMIRRGLTIGLTGYWVFTRGLKQNNLCTARTMALAVISVSQLLHALDCRKSPGGNTKSSNFLKGAVLSSAALLLAAIYLPFGHRVFKTCSLTPGHWLTVLAGSILSQGLDGLLGGLSPKN